MNIYKGCTHGCISCDPGIECCHIGNFNEILVQENTLQLAQKELTAKGITGVIGTGLMSDSYNVYGKNSCSHGMR